MNDEERVRCDVCGDLFFQEQIIDGMCMNCASSLLQEDEIDLGFREDFD